MSGPIVLPFDGKTPRLGRGVFLAPNATVIGDVELGDEANVWFGAVVRADVGSIRIGARTNVQDLACIHMTGGLTDVAIGDDVTIGHGAILHGCTVGSRCLIGMGAILLDGATIGEGCLVAAGALVAPRFVAPPGHLVLGNPARVVRPLRPAEVPLGRDGAMHYVEAARRYAVVCAETRGGRS